MKLNYAVNIVDLASVKKEFSGQFHPVNMLLNREILSEEMIDCEKGKIDGMAVRVNPNLTDERWNAILLIVRNGAGGSQGIPKHKLRIYESKTGKGSWRRI